MGINASNGNSKANSASRAASRRWPSGSAISINSVPRIAEAPYRRYFLVVEKPSLGRLLKIFGLASWDCIRISPLASRTRYVRYSLCIFSVAMCCASRGSSRLLISSAAKGKMRCAVSSSALSKASFNSCCTTSQAPTVAPSQSKVMPSVKPRPRRFCRLEDFIGASTGNPCRARFRSARARVFCAGD